MPGNIFHFIMQSNVKESNKNNNENIESNKLNSEDIKNVFDNSNMKNRYCENKSEQPTIIQKIIYYFERETINDILN